MVHQLFRVLYQEYAIFLCGYIDLLSLLAVCREFIDVFLRI